MGEDIAKTPVEVWSQSLVFLLLSLPLGNGFYLPRKCVPRKLWIHVDLCSSESCGARFVFEGNYQLDFGAYQNVLNEGCKYIIGQKLASRKCTILIKSLYYFASIICTRRLMRKPN
ncbi:hypothetical protein QVD17_05896 [Tagetes erecta]|uniref:Uncharacterized protein n=1 Tax=Tagetes erecta TaxID=13708 RepID=A0AAD8PBV4_TARER|nr:hypothetical protein QVD17_05896 [Tagetes erecta]